MAEQRHRQNSRQSRRSQKNRSSPGVSAAAAAGQHYRGDRESLWNLVQEYCQEDDPAKPDGNQEPRRNRDAVKKRVDKQANENRHALVRMEELVVMGLFAEVEMGGDGVLEKMDDQIAKQNQERCIMSAEFEAGGNNFHQRGRQHESCSQSDEIFQISSLPVPLHDDGAAENIGRGSREAEEDTCQDWIHQRGDNNISVLSSQFSVLSSQFSKLCTGLKFVAWCSAVTDDFSGPCQDECGGGHGKFLSRAGGVTESHAVGNRDLSGNENLSNRGAIWPHEPAPAGRCFSS